MNENGHFHVLRVNSCNPMQKVLKRPFKILCGFIAIFNIRYSTKFLQPIWAIYVCLAAMFCAFVVLYVHCSVACSGRVGDSCVKNVNCCFSLFWKYAITKINTVHILSALSENLHAPHKSSFAIVTCVVTIRLRKKGRSCT